MYELTPSIMSWLNAIPSSKDGIYRREQTRNFRKIRKEAARKGISLDEAAELKMKNRMRNYRAITCSKLLPGEAVTIRSHEYRDLQYMVFKVCYKTGPNYVLEFIGYSSDITAKQYTPTPPKDRIKIPRKYVFPFNERHIHETLFDAYLAKVLHYLKLSKEGFWSNMEESAWDLAKRYVNLVKTSLRHSL